MKYAEEYLKEEGYKVVLTRNEDKLVPFVQGTTAKAVSSQDAILLAADHNS